MIKERNWKKLDKAYLGMLIPQLYSCSELAITWVVLQPYPCFFPGNNISQKWIKALAFLLQQPQQKCPGVCSTDGEHVIRHSLLLNLWVEPLEENTGHCRVNLGKGRFQSDPAAFRGASFAKYVLEELWEEGEMLLLHVRCKAHGCDRLKGHGYSAYICWQLHPLCFIAVTEEQRKAVRRAGENKNLTNSL